MAVTSSIRLNPVIGATYKLFPNLRLRRLFRDKPCADRGGAGLRDPIILACSTDFSSPIQV